MSHALDRRAKGVTSAFQPRRLMIVSAADGCKRVLASRVEAAFSRARSCLIERTGYPLCRRLKSNSQPAASHQPDAIAHTVIPVITRSMKRCPVSASFVPSIIVARPVGCDLRSAGFTDHRYRAQSSPVPTHAQKVVHASGLLKRTCGVVLRRQSERNDVRGEHDGPHHEHPVDSEREDNRSTIRPSAPHNGQGKRDRQRRSGQQPDPRRLVPWLIDHIRLASCRWTAPIAGPSTTHSLPRALPYASRSALSWADSRRSALCRRPAYEAAAFDENSRALNPADRLRQLADDHPPHIVTLPIARSRLDTDSIVRCLRAECATHE